jgi:hypothetical protein
MAYWLASLSSQAQDRGGLAVPRQERGAVAVLTEVADERFAEAGPAAGDVGGGPRGDGVAGLLVGCLRHAFHNGRNTGQCISMQGRNARYSA